MPILDVKGTIEKQGGGTPGFSFPIRVGVLLGRFNILDPYPYPFEEYADTYADSNGDFQHSVEIPESKMEDIAGEHDPKLFVCAWLRVLVGEDVQFDYESWPLATTGEEAPSEVLTLANQKDAHLAFDFSDLHSQYLNIVDRDGVLGETPWVDVTVSGFPTYQSQATPGSGVRQAALLLSNADAQSTAQSWFRWRRDQDGDVVIRSQAMPIVDLLKESDWGLLQPVHESVPIPTLNLSIPARMYCGCLCMRDTYIEVDGGVLKLYVPSVGFHVKKKVLFNLASVTADVRISFRKRESIPFTLAELTSLFEVDVCNVEASVPGGTDLDDLPWWVWIILAALASAAGGSAAAEPVARTRHGPARGRGGARDRPDMPRPGSPCAVQV